MDSWNSRWLNEDNSSSETNILSDFRSSYCIEDSDSLNISKDDSVESCGDEQTEKNEATSKPTFKSVLQAKKRLQAFSTLKQLKRTGSKEGKFEEGENKPDKTSPKKSKKALYPDDKAKAVIKEIEEIKKMEGKHLDELSKTKLEPSVPLPLVVPPVKSISLKEVVRERSRSVSSEREHFKKREIKSRNYRRKSVSPDDHFRRKSATKKVNYPKDWTEYKEQGLTIVKDDDLKLKLFPRQKYAPYELVSKIITFDTPSPIIESFKSVSVDEKLETIPTVYMRVTRSKPSVTYSINSRNIKESYISRRQLFNIIPQNRRDIIEKLIQQPSRVQPSAKKIHSRQWYYKSWKKIGDAECKILENSVGLSFLQTYSDEEEENEADEIVICSSTKENGIRNKQTTLKKLLEKSQPQKVIKTPVEDYDKFDLPLDIPEKSKHQSEKLKSKTDKIEKDDLHTAKVNKTQNEKEKYHDENITKESRPEKTEKPKLQTEKSLPLKKYKEETTKDEKEAPREFTPERKLIKPQVIELNETKRAIRELEEELERRKAIKIEEELQEEEKKVKKKKRKTRKKKVSSSDSSSDEEVVKKKTKKKSKFKKKAYTEEESTSLEEDNRKKKKQKKEKYKKEKFKKKKEKNKKEDPHKELKTKKKDEDSKDEMEEEVRKEKKKKISTDETISSSDRNKPSESTKSKNSSKKKNLKKNELEKLESDDFKLEKETVNSELKNKRKQSREKDENIVNESTEKKQLRKHRWDNSETESDVLTHEKGNNKLSDSVDSREVDIQTSTKHDNTDLEKSQSKENIKNEEDIDRFYEEEFKRCQERERSKKEESNKLTGGAEKLYEEFKIPNFKDAKTNNKHSDDSDKKYTHKEKSKDANKSKKYNERDKKTSEKGDKNESRKKNYDDSEKYYDKLGKYNQKTRHEDSCDKLEKVHIKEEPDWDDLKSKRRNKRDDKTNLGVEDFVFNLDEDGEVFPLEKETRKDQNPEEDGSLGRKSQKGTKVKEVDTPDTNDYRENWEKDPFPIWESEDDFNLKPKEKLNNSWESDEELFEKDPQERSPEKRDVLRPFSNTLDLEIPLNIKPFKRREVINPDIELQLLKYESITLSEERRILEIEKQRVKELELKVIKEVEGNTMEDVRPKRKRSTDDKPSAHREREKDGRWDKKQTQHKKTDKLEIIDLCKTEKHDETGSVIDISSSSSNNTSNVLENEYEEFMKAVTSSATPRKRSEQKVSKKGRSRSSSIGYSDSEVNNSENSREKKNSKSFKDAIQNKGAPKSVQEIPPVPIHAESPAKHSVTILPKDIPFIPMPAPIEAKPIPVPSPQIDVDKIPKPMINLSLSANITLDIASKLAPANMDSPSSKVVEFINPSSASLDIAPKITTYSADSPTVKFVDFRNSPLSATSTTQSPNMQTLKDKIVFNKSEANLSPFTDVSTDSVLFSDQQNAKSEQRLNKPFVFTSMVIPSKKLLIDNSKLNLGDSDDERGANSKTMRKLEEIKKEYLIDSTETPSVTKNTDVQPEKPVIKDVIVEKSVSVEKKEKPRSRSPLDQKQDMKRHSKEDGGRRESSPRGRSSHGRRAASPRRRPREPSPKRRRYSPRSSPRRHSSPRKRLSPRRRGSPAKRKHSPRRSISPRYRKRISISPRKRNSMSPRRRSSISPRRRSSISPGRRISTPRRSPRRSHSPKMQSSPKRMRSKSPENRAISSSHTVFQRPAVQPNKPQSPVAITSPLDGLKRSVADSTISDDLLSQLNVNTEDYTESPISRFYNRIKTQDSPKRIPLDERINQVLGVQKEEPKPIPTTYSNYAYQQAHYSQDYPQMAKKESATPVHKPVSSIHSKKSNFVQVGNMVRIVPTENFPSVSPVNVPYINLMPPAPPTPTPVPDIRPTAPKIEKTMIVQVGNMLQIVPVDIPIEPPLPPETKIEPKEPAPLADTYTVAPEKQSAETAMKLKIAERRAEREQRRLERERRRREKEKRRKEKEKQRQVKLKQKTEEMIKRALQLEMEGLGEEEEESFSSELVTQWPPSSIIVSSVSKEVGRSILIKSGQNTSDILREKKIVQFADGVRPGEGTSPSGGEELSSPPPSKKLPKEKRYKKTKLHKKSQKKKVKVKIIKKRAQTEESDDEDNLPPPSPPPGSPPPHLFPPRIKTHTINNIHPYIPTVVPIQVGANNTQQQLYRPQVNLIMHHHGPPHHGPPHHGPPPPPPPHHGPPHHHHGPPPPGPPHFHHGPPPPPSGPPHHHGPPPPPPHGHHHGPPPPYHH